MSLHVDQSGRHRWLVAVAVAVAINVAVNAHVNDDAHDNVYVRDDRILLVGELS